MRLGTARLRTALGHTPERRRPGRRFTPVEQVWRAPVRPLLRHVHHQHLSSTNLQLRVAVGVQVAAASHPIRLQAVSRPPARGPIAAAATYPDVVFRDRVPLAAVAAAVAGQPAWQPVPPVHTVSPPASPARATSAARAGRGALPSVELVHRLPAPSAARAGRGALPGRAAPAAALRARVELVHRLPAPSASGAVAHRPADARANATASRPATRWADTGAPAAPGATPLTAADVPGVVDQVVREIDRRVVAARERRGWTA